LIFYGKKQEQVWTSRLSFDLNSGTSSMKSKTWLISALAEQLSLLSKVLPSLSAISWEYSTLDALLFCPRQIVLKQNIEKVIEEFVFQSCY
jgi:hypothetical protein